jgi:hypothetical protein
VPQTFGRCMWPGDLCGLHDGTNDVPALCPAPVPKSGRATSVPALLCTANVMDKIHMSRSPGGTGIGRYMPVFRFFALAITIVPSFKSTRSAVNPSASEIRHPVWASVAQNVRTSRSSASSAAFRNASRSAGVRYLRCPRWSWRVVMVPI